MVNLSPDGSLGWTVEVGGGWGLWVVFVVIQLIH